MKIEKYLPKLYLNRATDLDICILKEKGIKALILDVDNTLIDFKKTYVENLEEWIKQLKENSIQTIIVSNSFSKKKVAGLSEMFGCKYIYFANKPMKYSFKKASKILNVPCENIAVVGDQIFTDILGANKCGMFSVLVKPMLEKNDYLITKIKRPFEKYIIQKYLEQNGKNTKE